MLDPEDEGTRIGVWVALGVVFFVLTGVIGGVLLRELNQKAAAKAARPVVVAADAMIDAPLGGELLAKLYFDSGVDALPPDAQPAIEGAFRQLMTTPARKIVLSGFHDPSGDAKTNAELAKRRALAVRRALIALGADARRVLLRKPERASGDGSLQEARRVELHLVE
jgi:OmpA family